jgi:hypothetical protein
MYQLFRAVSLNRLATQEAPAIAGSFVIAELFYKFHSFTLECLAFLATWFVLSWIADRLARSIKR